MEETSLGKLVDNFKTWKNDGKKSCYWAFFKRISGHNDLFYCIECFSASPPSNEIVSASSNVKGIVKHCFESGTTSLKSHVVKFHHALCQCLEECLDHDNDNANDKFPKRQRHDITKDEFIPYNPEECDSSTERHIFNRLVVQLIADNNLTLNILDSKAFKSLIQFCFESKRVIKLPTRKFV